MFSGHVGVQVNDGLHKLLITALLYSKTRQEVLFQVGDDFLHIVSFEDGEQAHGLAETCMHSHYRWQEQEQEAQDTRAVCALSRGSE